ncbi:hypothetical protein T09_13173 [Trichinella sp. T9]|nr:hypothetical protein T09_13173 [Trichinella sp. T9]
MGSWVRLPASSTRCPFSLASVSGVSTCFAAQNSLYTQGANACKIVRLFSADIAIVSSSHSFVADQTQGLTSNDSQTAANALERRLRRFTFLHRSQDTGTSAWLSLLKLIKLTRKWAFTTFITFRIGIAVQKNIPRALNIRLVIYGNRRLYDFASGCGTQIASFHILASISGCTLRRILHISRCGANLPI